MLTGHSAVLTSGPTTHVSRNNCAVTRAFTLFCKSTDLGDRRRARRVSRCLERHEARALNRARTGEEAGERLEDGKFKEGTVNDLVDKRLRELGAKIKEFEGGTEEGAKEEKKKEGKPS